MLFEPLYHAREIATINLSCGCHWKAKLARTTKYCFYFFNNTIIPLILVGHGMIAPTRRYAPHFVSITVGLIN